MPEAEVAALNHIATKLSLLGWRILSSGRENCLIAATDDDLCYMPVKSIGLANTGRVSLGSEPDKELLQWLIVTTDAGSSQPASYVLSWDEAKRFAKLGPDGLYWIAPEQFAQPAIRNAWERLSNPLARYNFEAEMDWCSRQGPSN